MDESFLMKIAVIVLIIGFLSLFVIFALKEPDFVSPSEILPENNLVSFDATISDVFASGSGCVVLLHRTEELSGVFDQPLPPSYIGQVVRVSGRLEGDWFVMESIS